MQLSSSDFIFCFKFRLFEVLAYMTYSICYTTAGFLLTVHAPPDMSWWVILVSFSIYAYSLIVRLVQ